MCECVSERVCDCVWVSVCESVSVCVCLSWEEGGIYVSKFEKRLVSFIYFIVDNKIWLLSMLSREKCPYKYNSGWFPRWFRLFLVKISITLTAKVTLWTANKGHSNKKWRISSILRLHPQISEGVSEKLCLILWLLKGLKFTLNWKRYLSPKRLCIPKVLLVLGRIRDKSCAFRLIRGGIF